MPRSLPAKVSIKALTAIVLAAAYAALVYEFQQISFSVFQIRIADILSPLPYVMGFEAVVGLTIGTFIGNTISPYGVWDMAIGTLCTFTYTLIDWLIGKKFGYRKILLPVIAVINSVVVGLYIGVILISYIFKGGNPLELFATLTGTSMIPMGIGALVLVPTVRRFYRRLHRE